VKNNDPEYIPEPFGCRHCLPFTKGCWYCRDSIREAYTGFKPLQQIGFETLSQLQQVSGDISMITISGGGDPSCYPEFIDLIELLASTEAPLHIGYTSGKGFNDPDIADFLVASNMCEISFTIFSSNPQLRRKYMHDPHPEASLETYRRLAHQIDMYAAILVLPGVNDGQDLLDTVKWLEACNTKGIILMRFANSKKQGLILDNAPLIAEQRVHTLEEFSDIVQKVKDNVKTRVSATPVFDPDFLTPFAIARMPEIIATLPQITSSATLITGTIAAPYLRDILHQAGFIGNIIGVDKEIADLITIEDLKTLDPSILEDTIIIPGNALVHDREVGALLGDNGERIVIRGPLMLTVDGETAMGMTRDEVIEKERQGFLELISLINRYGVVDEHLDDVE
jgi:methanogenesis marker radical SAM protein